jgi:3'(2'), 5'-bisphosphate nucleotidase
VTAAGGRVTDDQGREIRFGERGDTGFIIPAFVAWGDPQAVVPID